MRECFPKAKFAKLYPSWMDHVRDSEEEQSKCDVEDDDYGNDDHDHDEGDRSVDDGDVEYNKISDSRKKSSDKDLFVLVSCSEENINDEINGAAQKVSVKSEKLFVPVTVVLDTIKNKFRRRLRIDVGY